MNAKRLTIYAVVLPTLLLIPLVAMIFSNEINWGLEDFILMFVMLLSLVFLSEIATRWANTKKKKIGILVLLIFVFILVWLELAVGIFGSPIAGS